MKPIRTISSALELPTCAEQWPIGWESFAVEQYAHYLNPHESRRRLLYFFPDPREDATLEGIVLQRGSTVVPEATYSMVFISESQYRFSAYAVHGTKEYGYQADYQGVFERDRVVEICDGDTLTTFQCSSSLDASGEPVCEMVRTGQEQRLRRQVESRGRSFASRLLTLR